jgi:DNA mismatch repair protein MutS
VREWQGEIIFLHQVIDGAADRSYGVHVARLAGLPPQVIARAQTLLAEMESGGHGVIDAERLAAELPLFTQDFAATPAPAEDPLRSRVEAINPDMLAPREALELLYELRDLLHAPTDNTRDDTNG